MEMMNKAIEEASDFRGMMNKIEARSAELANRLHLLQVASKPSGEPEERRITVAPGRQPGENRAMHRARLKRERRAKVSA
jgi:hypothetical protein